MICSYKLFVYRNGARLFDGRLFGHGVYVNCSYVFMQPYQSSRWPTPTPVGQWFQRLLARATVELLFLKAKLKGDGCDLSLRASKLSNGFSREGVSNE